MIRGSTSDGQVRELIALARVKVIDFPRWTALITPIWGLLQFEGQCKQ